MKFLILLCSLSLFGGAAFAQNLNIVSTSPSDGDFAVDTDSVVITFDQKMSANFFSDDSIGAGVFFFLTPEDSVQLTNLALSDDSLSVIYYVEFAANTDYIGFVVDAESLDGHELEDPYLFQFTTAPTRGEFVVEGTLDQDVLEKVLDDYPYEDLILALSPDPLLFGPGNDCDNEECEDDEITPNYAAFVDKTTGDYSVTGVREGTYFPIGLNFFSDNDEEGEDDEFFIPEFYFFDPNEDFIADSIAVNATTAPSDTLSDVNLRLFELEPITFGNALTIAESLIEGLDNSPIIVGGNTFYGSFIEFEGEEPDESFESFKTSILANQKPQIRHAEMAANDHQDGDDILDVLSNPSGFQFTWSVFGYDAIKDSAFSIEVSPFGAEFQGYIGQDSTNIPDSLDFTDVLELPDTFIDSDSAANIIEENGGWEFREEFSGEYSFWSVQLQALNNFWDLNEDTVIADAPVMWSAEYFGFMDDPHTNEFKQGYFIIYLDIETGEVLYSDSFVGGLGEELLMTFSEAIELAEEAISELDNDPVIVGGGTQYASISEMDDDEEEPDLATKMLSKMISSHEDHEDGHDDGPGDFLDFLSNPNGENIIWEVYGYDAVKDSAFALTVSLLGTEFNGYIGSEEAEFPDTVSFSDLEPLPTEFIDSDSAAIIVEDNGGWEFRDYFSGEYDFWEMELTALDNFWELAEDTLISDAPVMWTAEYYGFSYDPLSNFFEEGYFIIYIDIETGEVLYSDSEIGNGPSMSHITFDEAVFIADSVTEGFLLDKDIMGGITRYTNAPVLFKGAKNEVPSSYQKMVSSAVLDHPESIQPDGNAFSWEIFVYDEEEDSVLVLNVTEFDVFISEKFGDDELEDGVDFDDMLPLPFTHIDSDSAATLIDAEGALTFRTSKEEAELDWYWQAELQLMHQYWDYPLDMTPTAPITWRAEYYAWAIDTETNEFYEDSLTVYLDAESGDVLFSTVIVSNDEEPDAPEQFSLSQNYPNPFNPSTNIPFTLSEASKVEISIYSILGQKVATVVNDLYPVGSHSIQWNAQNLASGVYIYRMQANGFVQTRKLILLK